MSGTVPIGDARFDPRYAGARQPLLFVCTAQQNACGQAKCPK
jgi:hypothetical protein